MEPWRAPARELSNSMTGVLLGYVRRVAGQGAVDEVIRLAGEGTPLEELEDPTSWSSYEDTLRRFRAAAAVLDDPEIGRRAGEDLFAHYASTEVIGLLRSLGSPTESLKAIADTATKQSTVVHMECIESGETSSLIAAVSDASIRRDRIFCGYTAGVLGAMPTVFGLAPASVDEIECQRRGNGRCLYRVTWDPETATDPASHAQFLEARVAAVTGRFEALEELASELASTTDVEAALALIASRAGVATWAPQFLLAVRLPGESVPRIHSVGLVDDEAAQLAEEVLREPPVDRDRSRLIVDVRSSTHHFGRLAAIHPHGHRFLPEEGQLLQAYAGHAAATLATAAALEEARRRAVTMGALFDLATRLSNVAGVDEVAQRLADSVPAVVDREAAWVFLWEPDDAILSLRAVTQGALALGDTSPVEGPSRCRFELDRADVAELVRRPEPVSLGHSRLARVGATVGAPSGVVVPIVARHSLLGVLLVGDDRWPTREHPATGTHEALYGVASLAAPALDNARLLEEVRHQASHDPLTGLPNSRLLGELASRAIANARRHGYPIAVLFVDLDRFKDVNDEHGHYAGDLLLAEIAARLRGVLRAGDTVGRLGGDEFAVLLPHVADPAEAEGVARRILGVVDCPVTAIDHVLHLSASVGIAISSRGAETFDELLRRADGAMYRAKRHGRARFEIAAATGPVPPSR